MTHAELRSLALAILAAIIAIVLSACESTPTGHAARRLPAYEAPIAKSEFQTVRTTAYTHTESDHREYSNRNALGTELQAASVPNRRAENTRRAIPVAQNDDVEIIQVAYSTGKLKSSDKTDKAKKAKKAVAVKKSSPPRIGSAAADWARWPAGTTFRVLSTGQVYKVDDYGWALSGRNTIDLYMASPRDMNTWGVREEKIQILKWGDPAESFRLLAPHQDHPHIKRMMLELGGHGEEAAALQ